MSIINPMLLFTNQTRKGEVNSAPDIPLQSLGFDSHQKRGANQAGGNRVDICFHVDSTELTDRYPQLLARRKSGGGQRLERLLLFDKLRVAFEIPTANQIGEKALVRFAVGEIATSSHAE